MKEYRHSPSDALEKEFAFAAQELNEWIQQEGAVLISEFAEGRESMARSLGHGQGYCPLNLRHIHKEGSTHTFVWVRVWKIDGKTRSQVIRKPRTTRHYNIATLEKATPTPFRQLVLNTEARARDLREENAVLVKIRETVRTIRGVRRAQVPEG